jgi:hypothetical protein
MALPSTGCSYARWWRLPPPLPTGEAYYQGLAGLVAILGLIVLFLFGIELVPE